MKITYVLIFTFISTFLYSQEYPDKEEFEFYLDQVDGNITISVEQDWLVDWWKGKNFDRNYTQGTAFVYSKPSLRNTSLFLPFKILDVLHGENYQEINSSIALAVSAFTPLIIDSNSPIIGDRPFASVVALGTQKTYLNKKNNSLVTHSVNYGLFGTNITNVFQSFAHRSLIKGRPTDISWEHQISNGGHFAFLYSRKSLRNIINSKYIVANLGTNINLGWYTGVELPIELRIGKLSEENKLGNIETYLTNFNKSLEDESFVYMNPEKKQFECFGFYQINPYLMPYNSFILGQPHINSEYTLDSNEYIPFGVTMQYGLVLRWLRYDTDIPLVSKYYSVILSINHRSPEIDNSEFNRWHHWGRVTISLPLF